MALFMQPPLNGGAPWLSQALAVINPAATNQPVDRPLLDTDQTMTITVGNSNPPGGPSVTNVFAQYWVCAFSAGMASKLYLPSANGMKGEQIPVGQSSTHSVDAGQTHVFEDAFRPTSAEVADLADKENPGADFHACILANVFSSGLPTPEGAKLMTTPTIPPTSPQAGVWNPAGDVRQAQRNIALVTPVTDGVKAMDFMMHAGNPDLKIDGRFEMQITETIVEAGVKGFGAVEIDHLLRHPGIVRLKPRQGVRPKPGALPALAMKLGDDLEPIRMATKPLRGLQIDTGDGDGPKAKIALGADEARQIRLQARLPEADNTLRVFDVVQYRGRKQVGGARVLFLNAPAEFRRLAVRGKG